MVHLTKAEAGAACCTSLAPYHRSDRGDVLVMLPNNVAVVNRYERTE